MPWLTYIGLLTGKLFEKSHNTSMLILSQNFFVATWWDRYVLKLDFEDVFHREIITSAFDIPCWYARTIIPLSTLNKHKKLFSRLESESLGSIIFGDNSINRKSLHYYPITNQDIEFQWLPDNIAKDSKTLWVRSSVFDLFGDNFYLIEILLPGLEKYLC